LAVEALHWGEDRLRIIDQTRLPGEVAYLQLETLESVWQAIRRLQVRGAPAIGVCAAYGVLVGVQEKAPGTPGEVVTAVNDAADYLATSRPTAVNLTWALDRMRATVDESEAAGAPCETLLEGLEAEARAIDTENQALCEAIGREGAALVREGAGILTHCNTGSLATLASGTALAPLFHAHREGRHFQVFADETRPLLQGARLTAWELMQEGIDVTLICDNTAAQVMREGRVQLILVGADRIAANGDTANKIGTYSLAVLAKAHDVPFYVAAPYSTFDLALTSGDAIPIEQRDAAEVTEGFGCRTAPKGVPVYSPAFDVTPAHLITGFITERGILRPPYHEAIAALPPTAACEAPQPILESLK